MYKLLKKVLTASAKSAIIQPVSDAKSIGYIKGAVV
jgi:hypothetical protein